MVVHQIKVSHLTLEKIKKLWEQLLQKDTVDGNVECLCVRVCEYMCTHVCIVGRRYTCPFMHLQRPEGKSLPQAFSTSLYEAGYLTEPQAYQPQAYTLVG